jgi:hypothetical protein
MEKPIQRMVSDVSRPPARSVAATEHTTQGLPIPPSAIGKSQMGS